MSAPTPSPMHGHMKKESYLRDRVRMRTLTSKDQLSQIIPVSKVMILR
jgi:hypothetical protein